MRFIIFLRQRNDQSLTETKPYERILTSIEWFLNYEEIPNTKILAFSEFLIPPQFCEIWSLHPDDTEKGWRSVSKILLHCLSLVTPILLDLLKSKVASFPYHDARKPAHLHWHISSSQLVNKLYGICNIDWFNLSSSRRNTRISWAWGRQ